MLCKILSLPGFIPGKEEEARILLQKIIAPESTAEEIQSAYDNGYLPDSVTRTDGNNRFCCARAAFDNLCHCYQLNEIHRFCELHCRITFDDTLMQAEFMADDTVLVSHDAVLVRTMNDVGEPGGLDLSGANLVAAHKGYVPVIQP